jgi:hypothetical protein
MRGARRIQSTAVAVAALVLGLVVCPSPSQASHVVVHGRIFIGPGWWPPYPYGWYPPSYYDGPPYYYYTPPAVEEPPVYIERPPETTAPAQGYWHFCRSANAYYPNVPSCPEPWILVPPRS